MYHGSSPFESEISNHCNLVEFLLVDYSILIMLVVPSVMIAINTTVSLTMTISGEHALVEIVLF